MTITRDPGYWNEEFPEPKVDAPGDIKVISEAKARIAELLSRRNTSEDYSKDKEIIQCIQECQDSLPMEFILESLTSMGHCPSVLYDDNGHFAVEGDGWQKLLLDYDLNEETTFEGGWVIPGGHWKPTVREALSCFLLVLTGGA